MLSTLSYMYVTTCHDVPYMYVYHVATVPCNLPRTEIIVLYYVVSCYNAILNANDFVSGDLE